MNATKHKPVRRGSNGRTFSYLKWHKTMLMSSLTRLLSTPFTSTMAIIVMAIAIALAGSFYVLVSNAQQLVSSLQTGKQVSLFLHEQQSDLQAGKLAEALRANGAIEKVTLISRQQALTEFKQYSGFGAALDVLESNPLPAVLLVSPKETLTEAKQLAQLLAQMQSHPAVDFAQMDMEWVARLQSIMQTANRVVVLLSGLFALAVIFITGNTIRSELQVRHDEIVVTKLVGGTNTFICLPFLYTGFWYGFISGVLAWCIVCLMLILIDTPLEQLSLLYQSQFQLHFLSVSESALLLLTASVLGVLGAFTVTSYQLRLLKPE